MPDPLRDMTPGQTSPFVTSAGTVNEVLRAARESRDKRGGELPGDTSRAAMPAQVTVWVKNDTGGSLPVFSVVALGTPIISAIDAPHEVRRTPVFPGTAPAAATNNFAVTLEPAGTSAVVRAAVLGVVPVDLNVTDAAHTCAAPAAGVTATLATGTDGPARIIWKDSGTGTKRAVVLLGRDTDAISSWKNVVRAASTANVTVASPGSSLDGYTLAAGDRVLLKDQTTPSENGIYQFNGAASALTRTADADAAAELDGAAVWVLSGAANINTIWGRIVHPTGHVVSSDWAMVHPSPQVGIVTGGMGGFPHYHTVSLKTVDLGTGQIVNPPTAINLSYCKGTGSYPVATTIPTGTLVLITPDRVWPGHFFITPCQYASSTSPGLLSELAQTIAGAKTFTGAVVAPSILSSAYSTPAGAGGTGTVAGLVFDNGLYLSGSLNPGGFSGSLNPGATVVNGIVTANGGALGVQAGSTAGDMLYWDGAAWIADPPPTIPGIGGTVADIGTLGTVDDGFGVADPVAIDANFAAVTAKIDELLAALRASPVIS